ncbi:hypothetical protein QAD02_001363 [Eretmocerus hayati]|uniref:Uncharacterized protein n=1 Tax=Eretmocerus hayati TaxID=131215 RepID=A0ACC2NFS9_9HYME|nr:hypothetical protein QAD02_001363 [Eretmocerus hayati]
MSLYKCRRWCFVPQCDSTSIRDPTKLFFPMPDDMKTKKLWFDSAHRADEPTTSRYYCCQDHFEIEEDMDNLIKFKMYGAPKILKLKAGAVPHKFACQNRGKSSGSAHRPAYQKLSRKRLINEILSEDMNQEIETQELDNDSVIQLTPKRRALASIENKSDEPSPNSTIGVQSSVPRATGDSGRELAVDSSPNLTRDASGAVSQGSDQPQDLHNSSIISCNTSSVSRILDFGGLSLQPHAEQESQFITLRDVGVQVSKYLNKPHFRSCAVMARPNVREVACQSVIEMKDQACSPVKKLSKVSRSESCTILSSSSHTTSTCTGGTKTTSDDFQSYVPSSEDEEECAKEMKIQAMNLTKYFISTNPKYYIGVTSEWMWVLDMLQSQSGLSADKIRMTLMKIRLDDNFCRLGHQFGLSASQVGRVFNSFVKVIAHFLKYLVYPVPRNSVKKNLPLPFRANFSNVYVIIDAFEIEIQKPCDPLFQALTWSEYKKCNTIKYIIAVTPDGTIVFISEGYGGRISDVLLFEICGIVNKIPENSGVMADRGFKGIDAILNEKKCQLIRPPSVSTSTKPSKQEVMLTKQIASLRIHVERVIRRVREYKILEPHAGLDLSIMCNIDDILVIVTGLINLQSPVIRT